MCVCKTATMKHYDTFAKRLSDVSSVCDALHIDYCMPRHKPITEGSECICVCVHPKHMAEYLKGDVCVLSAHSAASLLSPESSCHV